METFDNGDQPAVYGGDIQIQSPDKTDVSITGEYLLKSMLKQMWMSELEEIPKNDCQRG